HSSLQLYLCPSNVEGTHGHRRLIHASELSILISTRFLLYLQLFPNHIVAASVGLVSVAIGISIPIFYKSQIDSVVKYENTQPNGTSAHKQFILEYNN
ncbi:hypothetical protein QQP08_024479, partial [Theobroma cacao]